MAYFLLYNNEDGEFTVKEVNPHELARALGEGDYSYREFVAELPQDGYHVHYATEWSPEKMVLIKGEIILPQTVEVVTKVFIP